MADKLKEVAPKEEVVITEIEVVAPEEVVVETVVETYQGHATRAFRN